jgi:hypothetical protein
MRMPEDRAMATTSRCRILRVVVGLIVVLATACGSDPTTAPPDDTVVTSVDGSEELPPPTTPVPTTAPVPTTTPDTSVEPGTTLVWAEPDTCGEELDDDLSFVDRTIAAARLEPGGPWSLDVDSAGFDARTHSADEFRYRTALDCGVRAVQYTDSGDERFVVGAWTGDRRAVVIQATDAPETPYVESIRFQLFIDQVDGEWIADDEVWAGTRDNGETIIVAAADTSAAVAAKSWWIDVPRFDDIDVTTATQRYGIDVLEAAGARNVSPAEPASVGSEIVALQFATPRGLLLIATVAPVGDFDPAAPYVDGQRSIESIAGVDVTVTTGDPGAYAVGSVGWVCGDHVWFIDSVWGSVVELSDWSAEVIAAADC